MEPNVNLLKHNSGFFIWKIIPQLNRDSNIYSLNTNQITIIAWLLVIPASHVERSNVNLENKSDVKLLMSSNF